MPGFEPKTKVNLDPPKDDVIGLDYLSKCDGTHEGYPTYVAIKVSSVCFFLSPIFSWGLFWVGQDGWGGGSLEVMGI